jgi:adenylosuccinate synthase
LVDPNAVVISEREIMEEQRSDLKASIGSTQTGTGAAVLARVKRDGQARFAHDDPILSPFVKPSTEYLRGRLEANERVILEGTQGFGLSVLHTPHYPYATSRDTTAAGFVAEAGLSPLDVDDVVLVIRSFPIRVAGNSGPLPNEITWQQVTKESGHETEILEHTSVTKAIRRVGRFDSVLVRQAITINAPTRIVLNHLDYVESVGSKVRPTSRMLNFLNDVQSAIGKRVTHVGLGPAHVDFAAKD